MPGVTLRVPLNADLVITVPTPTIGITEVSFGMLQGNTTVSASLEDSRIAVVGQDEIVVKVPRSAMVALTPGPAVYDIVVKRSGTATSVQFGQAVIVAGVATVT